MIGAVQWLPGILSPILLAQRLGASDRVPLAALNARTIATNRSRARSRD